MSRRLLLGGLFATALVAAGARVARADVDPKSLYDVSFHANSKIRKGHSGKLTVTITARNGGELHAETPLSLSVQSADVVQFSKAKYTRADAKVTPEATSLVAPFKGTSHGHAAIDATLRFVVCNPSNCFPQKIQKTVSVSVE